MSTDTRKFRLLNAILVLFIWCAVSISAQTMSFTYQGRLNDGSAAANGAYDLQFALYDAATGGNQVGATLNETGANVTSGNFTVQLDFGSSAFPGADRYLEIRVKKPADASYTILNPRQKITSAPYAIRALNAATATSATTANGLSSACVSCVTDQQIQSLAGNKVTGNVANATNATNATNAANAANATNAATADSVTISAGNSIVNSINDEATNGTINSNRLPADVVRIKPAASQNSTSDVGGTDAMVNLRGNYNGSQSNFRVNHDGSLLASGVYDGAYGNASPLTEGSGTRMMWLPRKAAFRAGYVNGTQWDDANIGTFSTAFGENVRASGDFSFAAGRNTVAANGSSVAMGELSVASGSASVALGYFAHTNARQGSFVFSDRSLVDDGDFRSDESFRAASNHSFNVRAVGGYYFYTNSALTNGLRMSSWDVLGGNFVGSFVWTDRSNGDSITPSAQNQTIFRSSGGYTIYTSSNLASGVRIAPGSGTWQSVSDRNAKENIRAVNPRDILRKVLGLPISTWNYKTQNASIRHIGAMAQDFKAAFKVGEDDKHISTIDPDGVALAAIQGLSEEVNERTAKLQAENAALRQQVAAQQTQFAELEARLKKLEQAAPVRRKAQRRR